MSFARKAVHWSKEDVRAAAAVLREDWWDLNHSLRRVNYEQQAEGGLLREDYVIEDDIRPIAKLICCLDKDYHAVMSILIFVHEFRGLIEEAQQEEGAADAGSEPSPEGDHPDRGQHSGDR